MSMRIRLPRVHPLRCCTCMDGSSRMRPPDRFNRMPKSMSSMKSDGGVEAAEAIEPVPAYDAAGSPKCGSLGISLTMGVAVQKVAVLRDKSRVGGPVVIGADHGG